MIRSCYSRDVHLHLHLLKTATLTGKRSWASWWGRERGKKMPPMSGNNSLSVLLCHGVKPSLCPQLQCPNRYVGFNSKLTFGNYFFLSVFSPTIFILIQLCYALINSGANIFTSIFRIWRCWSTPPGPVHSHFFPYVDDTTFLFRNFGEKIPVSFVVINIVIKDHLLPRVSKRRLPLT